MDGSREIVIFRVGDIDCGLPRADVLEILPIPRLARWPGLPDIIDGFFIFGGRAVPALNAEKLFGLEIEEAEDNRSDAEEAERYLYHHMILLASDDDGSEYTLVVDRAVDFITIRDDQIMPVQESDSLNGCVAAEIPYQDGLAHLLETSRLLLAQEKAILADLTTRAEARLAAWQEGEP